MSKTAWGFHLCLDLAKCKPHTIRSQQHIISFSNSLVQRIDMIPFGKPQVVMFGTGNKKGYTLVQLISTSNICGHFCEEDNAAYLDVFSCKPYNINHVVDEVNKFFQPEDMRINYFERKAPELK